MTQIPSGRAAKWPRSMGGGGRAGVSFGVLFYNSIKYTEIGERKGPEVHRCKKLCQFNLLGKCIS